MSFLLKYDFFFSAGDMELGRIAQWNYCGSIQMDRASLLFREVKK